jgi:hypothetical protein
MNETTIKNLIDSSGLSSEDRRDLHSKVEAASGDTERLRAIYDEVNRRKGGTTKGYQTKMQRSFDTR